MSFRNYIGNIILNFMGFFFFKTKSEDMLSGFKGFKAVALKRLDLHSQKWDLNVEIHSKIRKNNLKFAEIPTNYFPRIGKSKLSGTTAAWNNLRYMLMHSPNFVFVYPSIVFILISLIAIGNIILRSKFGNVTLLLSTTVFLIGIQTLLFGVVSKTYLFKKGFEHLDFLSRIGSKLTLEKGIIIGLILFLTSIAIFLGILIKWLNSNKVLELIDIKFGIIGFTLLMASISIVTCSFMNQTISE